MKYKNTLIITVLIIITTTLSAANAQDPVCVKAGEPLERPERPDTIGANINDYKYIDQQARNLRTLIAAGNKTAYEYALTCRDNRLRAAASLIAAEHGREYIPDLIKNIGDQDIATQQAARQSLIRLARAADNITIPTRYLTGAREHIDFGPMAGDNSAQVGASQALWELWHRSLKPEQIENIEKSKEKTQNPQVNIKVSPETTKAGTTKIGGRQ